MIAVDHLSHRYPGERAAHPALDRVSLHVGQGQFCAVIGPNGSGKSTLFRILSGAVRPSEGRIALAGAPAGTAAARRALGVVFQAPALDGVLTVRENLALWGRLHGFSGRRLASRIDEVTAWTRIGDRLDDRAATLSGGQQRQAELAKCLIPAPPVLLLDEPTTGLDPAGRAAFAEVLGNLRRDTGLTVLMTTHVFDEAETADLVVVMQSGKVIAQDSPATLAARLGAEMVVIACAEPVRLAARLRSEHLSVRATAEDVRVGDLDRAAALRLVADVLERHGSQVTGIAIKQPTLTDVFLALTGETVQ
jgi:ABC-2 type transport system ATP-binding protein